MISQERLSKNEVLFHALSENILRAPTDVDVFEFACECADEQCLGTVQLTLTEYERVRNTPSHLVLLPGHPAAIFH